MSLGEGLREILAHKLPTSLRELDMRECELQEEDLLWMCEQSARGEWAWSGLDVLDLRGNYFSERVHEELAAMMIRERCDVRIDPWRMFRSTEDE